MDNELHKVFVYGTLKSGGEIRGLNTFGEGATIVGKAKTKFPDYHMIDLGAFPGVILKGTKYIQGEVWEVDDEAMEQLDMIEGYPEFYDRQQTQTTLGKAWMYYLSKDYSQDLSIAINTRNSDQIEEVDNTLIWSV
tara:strand:+ start:4697 stop:5104 length:408 start_codon:yes stop_codon:yes gene_type:complete